VNDVDADPRYVNFYPDVVPTRSELGVPIRVGEEIVGVLDVQSPQPGAFDENDALVMETLAHQVGAAIENARLAEEAAEVAVLQELNRLRSELIANVSHELRTPLGLIKVFGTTLLREDVSFDAETQREFLHNIDEETDRLAAIVDNLLDLSRIEGQRLGMDAQPTDVAQLVRQVVEGIAVTYPQHRFICDCPQGPLVATVDPQRIEQVLRNLLDNAAKYAPEGGAVTVGVQGSETQLHVWVEDQGIGIPSKDLEQIFERFYRVENEVTQRVRGAGLGLAVCRGIVEAHGGRIWAESRLGKGSMFHFTLPVEQDS
jgi:two-component system sensor histidine kinase KdpD